ncbi:hypothetical protein, partial [Escherichia coli]|uniref:hypothetical protein n=1 Tax=Escherichia coli TaxID=562 RepID=UPI0019546B7C
NTVVCDTTVTTPSGNVNGASPSSSDYYQLFTAGGVTATINSGAIISGSGLYIETISSLGSISFINNG